MTEYIDLYDAQEYKPTLDEQRRVIGLLGITEPLDIVLTNSNEPNNTQFGVDYAQNHGIMLLSPTTYAAVNSNTWPEEDNHTNFITNYSQSSNN